MIGLAALTLAFALALGLAGLALPFACGRNSSGGSSGGRRVLALGLAFTRDCFTLFVW